MREGRRSLEVLSAHSFIHSCIHSTTGTSLAQSLMQRVSPRLRSGHLGWLSSLCHAHPVWPWVSPFPSLCLICKRKWSLKSLLALILWGLQVSG